MALDIPKAILVATSVPIVNRNSRIEVPKVDPIIIPNCINVESNNVLMKNLRRIGPISFSILNMSSIFNRTFLSNPHKGSLKIWSKLFLTRKG